MTSISALSPSTAYWMPPRTGDAGTAQVGERIASTRDMPARTAMKGDDGRTSRLGSALRMDSGDVSSRASSASEMVDLLQSRGVDLGQLRNVLNSGDLLDVRA
jgi:hypothetical protein